MITELMPESLVLLAQELCLPLRSMVSVEKKERKQAFKVGKLMEKGSRAFFLMLLDTVEWV